MKTDKTLTQWHELHVALIMSDGSEVRTLIPAIYFSTLGAEALRVRLGAQKLEVRDF